MRIAFVCTANMCRSPMAELLCRRQLDRRGIEGVEVTSAGVLAIDDQPAVVGAAKAAAAHGIDVTAHRSRRFDGRQFGRGDLILVMEEGHRRQILAESDIDPETVRLLGEFRPGPPSPDRQIHDPIGGPDEAFTACFEILEACVEGLVTWLEEERISRS